MTKALDIDNISSIYHEIKNLVISSRKRVYKNINYEMVLLYWNIGRIIIDIQDGRKHAKYDDRTLEKLSVRLIEEFGKGFSLRNLRSMRNFYSLFPNRQTLFAELSWSHYLEIMKVDSVNARNFYIKETINSNWSVRELKRQISSLLYERLTLSADKEKVLELSEKGQILKTSKDLIKDPFILEFLELKENNDYLELDLEKAILNHLKEFLLELGKGFMYVGSQVRITLEEDHFYPDLVFYNRILKCFVIIDLKIGTITHKDLGQISMYVNYYDREIKSNDENQTIGILLCTNKNETVVKYSLPLDNNQIYASKYKLNFPSDEDFIYEIETEKQNYYMDK